MWITSKRGALWAGGAILLAGAAAGAIALSKPKGPTDAQVVTAAAKAMGWPIEITPGWAQKLALLLPTGWTMGALHRLMSFQAGAAAALPYLAILALAAAAIGWIATRTFRYA